MTERRQGQTRKHGRRSVAGFFVVVSLLVPIGAAHAQWLGAQPFQTSFNNPISAWANSYMWQNMNASVAMRAPLEKLGYTSEQLDHMSADEMIQALKGAKPSASSAVAIVPVTESTTIAAQPATLAPSTKTVVAKGDLAGLTFPVTTATKFTPTKKRLATKQLIAGLTSDPTIQQTLSAGLELGFKEYEREAAADGLSNDVAGATAFFVGVCEFVVSDVEPDDQGVVLVARLLQQQWENPQFKKIAAADKQRMYEFLVGFGIIVLASYETAKDASDTATVKGLKDGCRSFGQNMLHADLNLVKITGFGLEKA